MAKRISAVFFLLVIFSVSAVLLWHLITGGFAKLPLGFSALEDGSFARQLECYAQAHIPGRERMEQLAIALKTTGGSTQVDGVLITERMLMNDLQPPEDAVTEGNIRSILQFADRMDMPSYVMLIPTACAVKQQELPDYIELYNQKAFIEQTYARFEGTLSVVDTYLQLLAAQEDYIYYRTQDTLTAKGGYLIYQVLGRRLGITPLRELEQFDISYASRPFYGDLFTKVPYEAIEPDRESFYRFSRYRREYRVIHHDQEGVHTYYTLFPQFTADLKGERRPIVLGGMSPLIEITSTTDHGGELLIFGDETVLSYIPFLLVHYSGITIVDVESCTPQQLEQLELDDYQQVLFGVSVDTFIHTPAFSILDSLDTIS